MSQPRSAMPFLVFFFNDTATTEIYTLSLHDALPISPVAAAAPAPAAPPPGAPPAPSLVAKSVADAKTQRLLAAARSEEHTSELQSPDHLVCRLLLEKKHHKTTALPLILTPHAPPAQC